MSKSYTIWTIGCQMNLADSRQAAEALEALGYIAAPAAERADLIVLNTCVVRQSAEDKAAGRIQSLKSVKRRRPSTSIVVMGCLVGDDLPALRQRYPHVDAFLRPSDVAGLVEHARRGIAEDLACLEGAPRNACPVAAYVPVMLGCDHHCTYCIVTLRRGPGRSLPIPQIVEEAGKAVAAGAREITLLGQNVDDYGHDLPGEPDLADVLRAIHDLDGLWRIRFLTSHPADLSDRLIAAVAELPKVCPHFELPIQAGDDLVLKRMGRGYTVDDYRRLVGRIRHSVPGASIATDVIVGFPGESDEQFQRTMSLLEEIRFDAVHVAAYSPRPGTAASRLADDVPPEVKAARRQAVEDLQERIVGEINGQLAGQAVEVLVEEPHKVRWKGRTRTNKLVFFEHPDDWQGKLAQVRITWAGPWSLLGEVTPAPRG